MVKIGHRIAPIWIYLVNFRKMFQVIFLLQKIKPKTSDTSYSLHPLTVPVFEPITLPTKAVALTTELLCLINIPSMIISDLPFLWEQDLPRDSPGWRGKDSPVSVSRPQLSGPALSTFWHFSWSQGFDLERACRGWMLKSFARENRPVPCRKYATRKSSKFI